jgi:hypothetical protein
LFNFYLCELSAVTVLLARVLAALHLENDDLVTLYKRIHYFYHYLCTFYLGCTDSHCAVIIYEQHLVEFNSLTGLYIFDVMNEELLALLCLKLLTVNFYDCVHFIVINGFVRQANNPRYFFLKPLRILIRCKITKISTDAGIDDTYKSDFYI